MSIKKSVKLDLMGNSVWDAEFTGRWLETYANDALPEYVEKWMKALGAMAAEEANIGYQEEIASATDISEKGVTVAATHPQVGFWEFGAGYYAQPEHDLADGARAQGIDVYPGSWSMGPEGEGHFAETDAAHPPGPVPLINWQYNEKPRYGLLRAWLSIKYQYADIGGKVFKS